jgi:hypothetical protein
MRNFKDPYQIGKAIEYNNEPDLIDLVHFDKLQHAPSNREKGFRAGTIDKAKHMEEGEEPGSIASQSDEETRNAAMEEFADKIKKAVSSKLMGGKLKLKIKGHPSIVKQVMTLIQAETDYLKALTSGQSADTPALQKNKAIIEKEAKELDRMLGTIDFWPFK